MALNKDVRGIVVAKTCECCGHHEIGIETKQGIYYHIQIGDDVVIKKEVVDGNNPKRKKRPGPGRPKKGS